MDVVVLFLAIGFGLRLLEKYAVRCGGGKNHRFGLDDAVVVKNNQLLFTGC